MAEYIVEPFRIKVIEAIKKTTREERQVLLAEAGYNPLLLRAEDVYIDLLTDSGTAALSDNQWAGLVTGDESYAGCKNFYNLQEVVKTIFGFEHFVPTHQGRPAERILFTYTTKSGDHIPSNMFFDSTRAHVEIRGAHAADLIVDEGLDPQ
ncbi:MAG: beta-eliminating lyase-related protein, partial [Anaerolineae bacterium]